MVDSPENLLRRGVERLQLEITTAQNDALLSYVALLDRWNKVFNLTAVRDQADMVVRHILDSLSLISAVSGKTVIDVGTGAGLPGIPLAIMRPDKSVTLLDSNGKKTRFLHQAATQLELTNTQIVHSRVRDYRSSGGFDHVVTRAFASSAKMARECAHLLTPSGTILAMKAAGYEDELAELDDNVQIVSVRMLDVPFLGEQRVVVSMKPTALQEDLDQ